MQAAGIGNVTASGAVSETITWTLYDDGKLEIEGTGKMPSYEYTTTPVPWKDYKEKIIKISIGNGVTSIGDKAFMACGNLKSAEISDSVLSIEKSAFRECVSLSKITLSQSLKGIYQNAFEGSISLTEIALPETLTGLG